MAGSRVNTGASRHVQLARSNPAVLLLAVGLSSAHADAPALATDNLSTFKGAKKVAIDHAGFEDVPADDLRAQPADQALIAKVGHDAPLLRHGQEPGRRPRAVQRPGQLRQHHRSGGFLSSFTGKARAAVEAGPTLMPDSRLVQISAHDGARIFASSPRGGNAIIALDAPLIVPADGFVLEDVTTAESKRSDGIANAVSIGLNLLTGGRAASQQSRKQLVVRLSEDRFNESYLRLIGQARDAFVDKLASAR